jgi:hypothetical protein
MNVDKMWYCVPSVAADGQVSSQPCVIFLLYETEIELCPFSYFANNGT